jgi:hypothetical protein
VLWVGAGTWQASTQSPIRFACESSNLDENRLLRVAGWAALLSVAAYLLGLATFILFVASGDFGPLADLPSLFYVAFTIPVVLALHVILRSQGPALSLAAATIGILGLLVLGIFQALLITHTLTYEQQSPIVISAAGAVGIWPLLANYLALRGKVFPVGLIWAGLIAGVGLLLLGVGFWAGGQQSPVSVIGALTSYISYPIWVIWLGRWLLRSSAGGIISGQAQRG